MFKDVKQIRELDVIEKELHSLNAGLLAFSAEEGEKIIHVPSTFIYHDKNIYLFVFNPELIEKIIPGSAASFSTIRSEKVKEKKKENQNKYEYFSVSVKGIIKKVDDVKTFDEVKKKYFEKYSSTPENENTTLLMENLIIIDTEELQAVEEFGG